MVAINAKNESLRSSDTIELSGEQTLISEGSNRIVVRHKRSPRIDWQKYIRIWERRPSASGIFLIILGNILGTRGNTTDPSISTTPSTPLHLAAMDGNVETVQALLKEGANVTAKDKNGNMPIHVAALSGKTQVVNLLIEHDPDLINAKGSLDSTPLHGAAFTGHTETLLALLNKGANINAKANYSNDPAGSAPSLTPLHLAAVEGNTETVLALLNKGADVTAKDKYGNMPIHLAASSGKTQVVNALIEHDPSLINARDQESWTPLHWAANKGHIETVQALLSKGANFSLRNSAGQQPLGIAANEAIASLLRSYGTPRHKRATEENTFLNSAHLPYRVASTLPELEANSTNAWPVINSNSYNSLLTNLRGSNTRSLSAIGLSSSAAAQNFGLINCIVNALYNSTMNSHQALINQGVSIVSTEVAVECARRDFASFVEKEMKDLNSEEQIYASSKLEKAYPRIIARLERAHQNNGERGLDKALKLAKERFCDMLLTHAHVESCLANVNVEALNQAVARN